MGSRTPLAPTKVELKQYMRDSLRVLCAAFSMAGNTGRVTPWYRNTPIPKFGHGTAEQLVSDGRTEAVVSYLSAIESGSTGWSPPRSARPVSPRAYAEAGPSRASKARSPSGRAPPFGRRQRLWPR